MYIKIEKPVIESILNQIIPFTEKKDNTQITSHILIKANEKLILKATDKEIGIKIITNAEIIESGTITINGKRFLDIIKTLQNKEIEIQTQDNQITITQDNSIYKLTSFNTNQFPEFPNTDKINKIDNTQAIKTKRDIIVNTKSHGAIFGPNNGVFTVEVSIAAFAISNIFFLIIILI